MNPDVIRQIVREELVAQDQRVKEFEDLTLRLLNMIVRIMLFAEQKDCEAAVTKYGTSKKAAKNLLALANKTVFKRKECAE